MTGSTPPEVVRHARTFIVVMGVVAMFGDMTYEGARGLVGPYLLVLGAGAGVVGFAAGLGEFLGYALRLVSGWIGDRTGRHWPLVIGGYALNLVAVPGLALVGSWQAAIALMVLERIGKAIRSPARSVLVSHAAHAAGVGRSFAIEEALDQFGAVVGPLLTALAMWIARDGTELERFRAGFAILLIPVVMNLALVVLARRRFPEPRGFEPATPTGPAATDRLFRLHVAAAMLLGLGFADWALVAYHAARVGTLDLDVLPLLYAGAMAVDALAALAFGMLFDRHGPAILAVSTALSALFAPLVFMSPTPAMLALGAACWGIGMGAQESVFKAVIAVVVAKERRGRAYGTFYALFGLSWWIGSATMGWLYERSIIGIVVFSLLTQLAAIPLFVLVGRRLRRATIA